MKTQLIIVSIVAALLAASTGVGFWMWSDTKAELTSIETELAVTEAENADLNETLVEAKARMEVIEGIFVPAMTGELDEMTDAEAMAWFLAWQDQVEAIGDPTLEAKFQVFIASNFSDAALLSFFVYLFESTAEALE